MPDTDALDERLSTIERALTDGEDDLTALADAGTLAADIEALRERLDELESQVADLDAATQALRGYVGNIESVNRDVERRADTALATVEKLEQKFEEQGKYDGTESTSGHNGTDPAEEAVPREHRCEHCGATRADDQDTAERVSKRRTSAPDSSHSTDHGRHSTDRSRHSTSTDRIEDPSPSPSPSPSSPNGRAATDGGGGGGGGVSGQDQHRQHDTGRNRRGNGSDSDDEDGLLSGLRGSL